MRQAYAKGAQPCFATRWLTSMVAGRLAGLAALVGSGVIAVAMLASASSRQGDGVGLLGFGLLAVSTFLIGVGLRRATRIGAALGMAAVGVGTSLAVLAGRDFFLTGSLAVIAITGLGVGMVFIAAPIVGLGAAWAGLVGDAAALALTAASALVLVATALGGAVANTVSFVFYLAAWGWIGLSLLMHARTPRQSGHPGDLEPRGESLRLDP